MYAGPVASVVRISVPAYIVLTGWWALVGIGRTVATLLAWWHVPDVTKLERQAAADGLLSDHLRIHKAGKDTRTARGLILAGCAVVVVAALVILSRALPEPQPQAIEQHVHLHGLSAEDIAAILAHRDQP